jgi:hypothetical protein
MNKYNIRAIRKELDDYVRNNKWSRVRSKLETLQSNPKLLQAIILAKSKLTSGSLLHALAKLPNTGDAKSATSGSVLTMDLVISVAAGVPMALQVQDSQLQTPLHIAIDRQQHPKMIQAFLEIIVAPLDDASDDTTDETSNKMKIYQISYLDDIPLLYILPSYTCNYCIILFIIDCAL